MSKSPIPRALRVIAGNLFSLVEWVVWGGQLRERALLFLLARHYRSRFRRDWKYAAEKPHFFRRSQGWISFGEGTGS